MELIIPILVGFVVWLIVICLSDKNDKPSTPIDCPPNVRAFVKKFETIEAERLRLFKAITGMALGDGKVNITPLVHLYVYNDWLQSAKEAITA